ncbi:MAG TPA: dihydrofolate reductase family protein [Chitinophagaceae bacterium]|nr:dihydrofolate reductase family protein [Chitinophagaceae bacterium]
MRISVDGYVAGPNGEEDWDIKADKKLWQLINELPDSSDTLLLGRKMAENFVPHFEALESYNPKFAFAQKMINIPKIIFSKTLNKPFGKNTSLAKGNLADEIAKLKNQNGKDILVYGGAGFVSSLIAGGHIDEFYFFVIPVMINKGIRIFDLPDKRQKLSLISTTAYNSGVVVLRYKLKNE